MTGRLAAGGGGLAALVLLSLWISLEAGGSSAASADRGTGGSGFVIAMRDVDVREQRAGAGESSTLRARNAEFLPVERVLSGRDLSLKVPGRDGPVVVEAPEGIWTMDDGRLLLSGGAVARGPGPWTGETASAVVDLANHVLSATGPAEVRGPGLTVTGRNLSWHWREGTVGLDAPRSRVEPARLKTVRKGG